jgi:spermidine synthase
LGRVAAPRVLIGGLGLGFTLKRVLELVGKKAVVHVSELLPEVVQWNRELLGKVNGELLKDPRVEVLIQDVFQVLRGVSGAARYDAILLDVDHTPASWVQVKNARLYERAGFRAVGRALAPDGLVAYWSAGEEPLFVQRLGQAGFQVQTHEAKAHPTAKRAVHRIYVGSLLPKPESAPASEAVPAQRRSAPSKRPAAAQRASGRRPERAKAERHPFKSPAQIAGLERKEMLRRESRPSSRK